MTLASEHRWKYKCNLDRVVCLSLRLVSSSIIELECRYMLSFMKFLVIPQKSVKEVIRK